MFSFRRSRRDEAWDAVVVGKSRGMPDGSSMYYYLKVKLADGTTKRVRVRRQLWNSLAEGDVVTKAVGEQPVKK